MLPSSPADSLRTVLGTRRLGSRSPCIWLNSTAEVDLENDLPGPLMLLLDEAAVETELDRCVKRSRGAFSRLFAMGKAMLGLWVRF